MTTRARCACGKSYNIPDAMLGKRVTCKSCGQVLDTSVAAAPPVSLAVASRAVATVPPQTAFHAAVGQSVWTQHSPPAQRESVALLTMQELRDPTETIALVLLAIFSAPVWLLLIAGSILGMGLPLLVFAAIYLAVWLAELFAAAYIKTNAVRVSDRQLPAIHKIVVESANRLGMAPPDVYVLQNGMWNAFATKLAGRRLIVLLSGAIDSILLRGDERQLAFVIGHELGHHAAGHLDLWRRCCCSLGSWLPWFLFWYRRREELTCDRVGLYCAGSLEAAQRALINMTVGAELAPRVDLAEAVRQWQTHAHEFFVRYRTVYASYPHHLWRLAAVQEAAALFGIPSR